MKRRLVKKAYNMSYAIWEPDNTLIPENILPNRDTKGGRYLKSHPEEYIRLANKEFPGINLRLRKKLHVSEEIMSMTFSERIDLGTTDYKELLIQALEEKYGKYEP